MKRSFLYLVPILAIALSFFGPGCANIVPPLGGPRDSLPPRLLRAIPGDSSTNFRGKTIELQFDEYVDLAEVQRNLLFTPTFNVNPAIEAHPRTLTIRLRDTLEPNTTYSFNFGDAIKDINESNVLHGFTYTFSTGPVLDSLTLHGQVSLAETGAIDTTLTVLLYRNLTDSAVVKERPRYISRLDGQGRFSFGNLPAGTFAIYALGDPGGSRRYQNKNMPFAFSDSAVVIRPGTPGVQLHAYQETKAASTATTGPKATPQPATDRRLKYNYSAAGGQDLESDLKISFDNKITTLDSSKVRLTIDSTFRPVPIRIRLDSTRKVLSIQTAWESGGRYQLLLGKDFATDSTGRSQLRTDTLRFSSRQTADYGRINLRFRNVDAKLNPVLQFVLNGTVVRSAPISSGAYSSTLFAPGDYELRVLYDRNGNGVWDPGHFFGGRRQPELVKPLDRRLTVKADNDHDVELALPDPSAAPVINSNNQPAAPAAPAGGGLRGNAPATRPGTTPARPVRNPASSGGTISPVGGG